MVGLREQRNNGKAVRESKGQGNSGKAERAEEQW